MSLDDAVAITEGVRPDGADWAEGYPAEATLVAAAMVLVADREDRELAPWGVFQAVRDGQVVAGLGFIGLPDADGVVRIGFSETSAAGDDMAVALAELIAHARAHGATGLVADAATARAAEVLTAAGMREASPGHFEA